MTSKYDRYSKEELVKIIEERDRKPRLGLVWERDEIDHDRSMNQDFVALDLVTEHSCGYGPWNTPLHHGFLHRSDRRRTGQELENIDFHNVRYRQKVTFG